MAANKQISPFSLESYLKALEKNSNAITSTYVEDISLPTEEQSYRYDPLDSPLKSTQQLNIDWSKFENHTFFSSAKVKINEAFNVIINSFPFDGTKTEVNKFIDGLSGFDKWILDNFPIFAGTLHFSGTTTLETPANGYESKLGTWIEVVDRAGLLFPNISKNTSGDSIITPDYSGQKSFTIEFHAFLPTQTNSEQIILQKLDNNKNGFTVGVAASSSTTTANIIFTIFDSTGSAFNKVSIPVKKGSFFHFCVTLNNTLGDDEKGRLEAYINSVLIATADNKNDIENIASKNSPLIIGSGSAYYTNYNFANNASTIAIPLQTFSGSLDELRIFDSYRNSTLQSRYENKGIFASPDLKLYYRFNEPFPLSPVTSDSINAIVLDSSGNSLHTYINNFTGSLRLNTQLQDTTLMTAENNAFKKILFPGNPLVRAYNASLLESGSLYDEANPNIITRLIPQHYLLEGALQDGFPTSEGTINEPYAGKGIPGQGKIGSTQILLSLLYIWSKFFDEMKVIADSFGTLRTVSYDPNEGIPDNFLEDYVKKFGFYLPRFFNNANLSQFIEGEDIDNEEITSNNEPLKKIQALMIRRMLVSLPQIAKSKGTIHSIKLFLRSIGVDPDNSLRIREFGNSSYMRLSSAEARDFKRYFSGVLNVISQSIVTTGYFSGSRVEPGYPTPAGSFVYDKPAGIKDRKIIGTNNSNDGLLTSGSWTVEGIFRLPKQRQNLISDAYKNQCLFRVHTTGSVGESLLATVIATTGSLFRPAEVVAYIRGNDDPAASSRPPVIELRSKLTNDGLFDGEKWNISIGRIRNDDAQLNAVSSSLFLRVAKFENNQITFDSQISKFYKQDYSNSTDYFSTKSSVYNVSGSFLKIGNQNIPTYNYFLNNQTGRIKTTDFVGQVSNLRFWSKALTSAEWKEHVRNFKSIGVEKPNINCDFEYNDSGSFERLRLNAIQKQNTKTANSLGEITFVDFSSARHKVEGKNFVPFSNVMVGDLFEVSQISPNFDEGNTSSNNKIRIVDQNSLQVLDDLRLAIEFSLANSLDEDIMTFMSSIDFIGNAIGNPELAFSQTYPDLEKLSNVYFNKLSGKLNFKSFLEFYRWFDASISIFIEQLLPMKTRYKGTNFVVESHVLERSKIEYKNSSVYITNNVVPGNLFNYQSATMK